MTHKFKVLHLRWSAWLRSVKSSEGIKSKKAEAALEQARDVVQLVTQATLLTAGFHTHKRQWRKRRHVAAIEGPINAKAEQIRTKFRTLLDRTNKENPRPQDVKALSELLVGEKSLELWRGIASAGYLAELTVIENARATTAVKEC